MALAQDGVKLKQPRNPLGLPNIFFPIYYTLVLCCTGYAAGAVEPLKGLLRLARVGEHLPDEMIEQKLCEITNAGYSLSIVGAIFAGTFCDFFGPKLTAMLGQALFAAGYALLFLVPTNALFLHYTGSCALGIAYSAIFNSHTSVAALYLPNNATLVLSILGSGPDVSLYVPTLLEMVAGKIGVRPCIMGYIVFIGGVFVLEMFLVPFKFFEAPVTEEEEADEAQRRLTGEETTTVNKQNGFASLSLKGQLATPHFWIFAVFMAVNMFRKTHYTQLVRTMMQSVGDKTSQSQATVDRYVNIFKASMPFAVIPALLMGVLANSWGILPALIIENIWSLLLYTCCSIPVMWVQWGSIIFFNLMSSYVFGILYAWLATYYGLQTLGTLQGVQMFIAGMTSFAFTPWNNYFVAKLPSVLYANRLLLIISLVMFVVPLYMYLKPPGLSEEADDESERLVPDGSYATTTLADRRSTTAFVGSGTVYDSASMNIIRRSVANAARQSVRSTAKV